MKIFKGQIRQIYSVEWEREKIEKNLWSEDDAKNLVRALMFGDEPVPGEPEKRMITDDALTLACFLILRGFEQNKKLIKAEHALQSLRAEVKRKHRLWLELESMVEDKPF